MRWKIPDNKYLDFLREKYEPRIPKTQYGESTFKPFFGDLFSIGEIVYVTQISHPQPRHYKIKNNKDFHKIYHPQSNNLMTIVNLNYMFPIHENLITNLDYLKIDSHIKFSSENEKRKRISFLNIQLKEINKLNLDIKAENLYKHKYEFPDDVISKRCLDFKHLELACLEYMNSLSKEENKLPKEPLLV
ncbi:MAG: type III toxin-antitoxin system ToxN/AbiQ family toxin [Oscillospiraceae bacterium]|nr:type III toxin-antitoxin system ToxN/AbiQ family toxin [Oscillospiraceae bacterium]